MCAVVQLNLPVGEIQLRRSRDRNECVYIDTGIAVVDLADDG